MANMLWSRAESVEPIGGSAPWIFPSHDGQRSPREAAASLSSVRFSVYMLVPLALCAFQPPAVPPAATSSRARSIAAASSALSAAADVGSRLSSRCICSAVSRRTSDALFSPGCVAARRSSSSRSGPPSKSSGRTSPFSRPDARLGPCGAGLRSARGCFGLRGGRAAAAAWRTPSSTSTRSLLSMLASRSFS